MCACNPSLPILQDSPESSEAHWWASLTCAATKETLSQTRKKMRTTPEVVAWPLHMHTCPQKHVCLCKHTQIYTYTYTKITMKYFLEKHYSWKFWVSGRLLGQGQKAASSFAKISQEWSLGHTLIFFPLEASWASPPLPPVKITLGISVFHVPGTAP